MSNKVKDIDIKHCTYYFFDGIINIKNFDPNNKWKKIKSHAKVFLFTTLDIWRSKIGNALKLIV